MKRILLTMAIVCLIAAIIPDVAGALGIASGEEIVPGDCIGLEIMAICLPGSLTPIIIIVPRDEQISWGEMKVIYGRDKND